MTLPDWRRPSGATILLALLLACLALAACGSSSGRSASTAAAGTAGATAGTTGSAGPGGARFVALRQCLQTNGITLPKRAAGTRRPPPTGTPTTGGGLGLGLGGGGGAGVGGLGRRLPAGVTQTQFQAALKKCGGGAPAPGPRRFATPAAKTALASFSTCMRKKGVSLPPPNTSGAGPVFNTTGVNTTTPAFKAAAASCQPLLRGVLGRNPAGRGTGATAP